MQYRLLTVSFFGKQKKTGKDACCINTEFSYCDVVTGVHTVRILQLQTQLSQSDLRTKTVPVL